VSTCRTCRASIMWAFTTSGKRIPVDADPVPDGNLALLPSTMLGQDPTAIVVAPGAQLLGDDGVRYVSHFVTCPYADQHRRR
jgi:hypothetical protein